MSDRVAVDHAGDAILAAAKAETFLRATFTRWRQDKTGSHKPNGQHPRP
jgi:hypothetical protein